MADFEALQNAAKKQRAEEDGQKQFSQARAKLVLGNDANTVFFASLALKLRPEQDWKVPTAATDGRTILYNPEWFAGLPLAHAKAVICHEVMHIAFKHHTRMGGRDKALWNQAADLAINPLLEASGLQLMPEALRPGKGKFSNIPAGLSAEEIYELLKKPSVPSKSPQAGDGEKPEGEEGQGEEEAKPKPGDMGTVIEPGDGSNAAKQEAEAEASVNVAQAEHLAKKRGSLSAGLDRLVAEAISPKVNWQDVLREFVSQKAKNEYRWSPSNRHFVHQDLYLPSRAGETLGEIAVAVDCSGSVGPEELRVFAGALEGIIEAFPVRVRIIYHEDSVSHVQEWEPADGPLVLEAKGGGGTSHVCVFEDIDHQPDLPTCVICLTDLYTTFPQAAPDYPVLWCVHKGPSAPKPPFGQTLLIEV